MNLSRGGYALLALGVFAFIVAARESDGVARASSNGGITVHVGNANNKSSKCTESDFTHVFVAIAEIQGHQSGKGVAGWHDLTTNLAPAKSAQVDLLDSGSESSETFNAPNDCVLDELGSSDDGIPPGNYQQFRMQLVPNGASPAPSPNACASISATTYNCIEVNGNLAPLTVPSGTIKIPGGLNVKPGQGVDLDIDVDACRDIIAKPTASGTPSYKLKPVVHAGAFSPSALIAGDVVGGVESGGNVVAAASPVGVPSAAVWLEQANSPDEFTVGNPSPSATASIAVEGVVAETTTDSNGHFVFCPVPNGFYEIVADASSMPSASGTPSDVTITKQVKVASGPNNLVIPLLTASAVTLNTEFDNAGPSGAATPPAATIDFGAVQSSATGPTVKIPTLTGTASNPVITSVTGCASVPKSCPSLSQACACFAINVPSGNPVIGPEGGPYAAPSGTADYNVFGQTSKETIKCSPPDMITPFEPAPFPTPTLSFVSCQ